MEFEDLQAIWDTQNERPVFSMTDARLAIGLHQQREQSRRRLFREQFAPLYVTLPFMAGFLVFLFLAFFFKTVYKFRLSDPQMSVWDGVALVIAFCALVAVVVSMHVQRRKHEGTQNVFAPSLREELEQGISQIDFELKFHGMRWVSMTLGAVFIAGAVLMWEAGRLNGNPTPWAMLMFFVAVFIPSTWYGFALSKKTVARVMERRRALESMLAGLKEDGL